MAMNPGLKTFLKGALVTIAGVIASCIFLEILLQFTDLKTYNTAYNDPKTGLLIFKPDTAFHSESSCFENDSKINNAGFHAESFSVKKDSGIFRIIIVGSSFTEALQVPLEKSYPYILEETLNADPKKKFTYQVIPFGISGNGTYLDMVFYDKYAKGLEPDLVIELATEYELTRNASSMRYPPRFDEKGGVILDLPKESQTGFMVMVKNILRNSKLIMNLNFKYLMVASRVKSFLAHPKFFGSNNANSIPQSDAAKQNQNLWETEGKLLDQFSEMVKTQKSDFILITWLSDGLVNASEYTQNYSKIAAENKFAYLDLTDEIKKMEQQENASPTWPCDGHWNENGHAWVAQGIYSYLQANPQLIWK